MNIIKNIAMLSIITCSIISIQAINKPGFIEKLFPDKTAEYYEKYGVNFSKTNAQLKEYIRLLDVYVEGKNEQAAILIAQKIVASPLLTREEKIKFAKKTGERIIRHSPGGVIESGKTLNPWLQRQADDLSEKIYPREQGHGW